MKQWIRVVGFLLGLFVVLSMVFFHRGPHLKYVLNDKNIDFSFKNDQQTIKDGIAMDCGKCKKTERKSEMNFDKYLDTQEVMHYKQIIAQLERIKEKVQNDIILDSHRMKHISSKLSGLEQFLLEFKRKESKISDNSELKHVEPLPRDTNNKDAVLESKDIVNASRANEMRRDVIVINSNNTMQHHPVLHFHDSNKHEDNQTIADRLRKKVRILCFIPSSDKDVTGKGVHILNTWGKRCDKLLFFTNNDVEGYPTVALHSGEKGNYDLSRKMFSILHYLYENYIEEYDWFLKADTDTYVILENLRYMLSDENPQKAVYFGQHFDQFLKNGYMSGGAGYVLSQRALHRFGVRGYQQEACKALSGTEDLEVGRCLQNIGIVPKDSRDAEGRTRFHCFVPSQIIHGIYPDWFKKYSKYGSKFGIDSISDYVITFHWVDTFEMYNLEFYTYHLRPYGIVNGPQNLNRISK